MSRELKIVNQLTPQGNNQTVSPKRENSMSEKQARRNTNIPSPSLNKISASCHLSNSTDTSTIVGSTLDSLDTPKDEYLCLKMPEIHETISEIDDESFLHKYPPQPSSHESPKSLLQSNSRPLDLFEEESFVGYSRNTEMSVCFRQEFVPETADSNPRKSVRRKIELWDHRVEIRTSPERETAPNLFLNLILNNMNRNKQDHFVYKDLKWACIVGEIHSGLSREAEQDADRSLSLILTESSLHTFMEERIVPSIDINYYTSNCTVLWWRIHSTGSLLVINRDTGRLLVIKNDQLTLKAAAMTIKRLLQFVRNVPESFKTLEQNYPNESVVSTEISKIENSEDNSSDLSQEQILAFFNLWVQIDRVSITNSRLFVRQTKTSKTGKDLPRRLIRFSLGVDETSLDSLFIQTHYVNESAKVVSSLPLSVIPFRLEGQTLFALRCAYRSSLWFLWKLHSLVNRTTTSGFQVTRHPVSSQTRTPPSNAFDATLRSPTQGTLRKRAMMSADMDSMRRRPSEAPLRQTQSSSLRTNCGIRRAPTIIPSISHFKHFATNSVNVASHSLSPFGLPAGAPILQRRNRSNPNYGGMNQRTVRYKSMPSSRLR